MTRGVLGLLQLAAAGRHRVTANRVHASSVCLSGWCQHTAGCARSRQLVAWLGCVLWGGCHQYPLSTCKPCARPDPHAKPAAVVYKNRRCVATRCLGSCTPGLCRRWVNSHCRVWVRWCMLCVSVVVKSAATLNLPQTGVGGACTDSACICCWYQLGHLQ